VLKRFAPILSVLVLCWLVYVLNNLICGGRFNAYGIWPRHVSGLPGIVLSPFLHGSLAHLAANSLPLLILGAILCARSPGEFILVCVGGTLLGGVLTWLFARNAIHIGASGLVFCFFGYLASQAYFKRTVGSLILSIVCLIGYGGMLGGLFPRGGGISWESHVAGLIAGVVIAWLTSNEVKKRRGVIEPPP
jgi:membrane associated rhomboid family serine protease